MVSPYSLSALSQFSALWCLCKIKSRFCIPTNKVQLSSPSFLLGPVYIRPLIHHPSATQVHLFFPQDLCMSHYSLSRIFSSQVFTGMAPCHSGVRSNGTISMAFPGYRHAEYFLLHQPVLFPSNPIYHYQVSSCSFTYCASIPTRVEALKEEGLSLHFSLQCPVGTWHLVCAN